MPRVNRFGGYTKTERDTFMEERPCENPECTGKGVVKGVTSTGNPKRFCCKECHYVGLRQGANEHRFQSVDPDKPYVPAARSPISSIKGVFEKIEPWEIDFAREAIDKKILGRDARTVKTLTRYPELAEWVDVLEARDIYCEIVRPFNERFSGVKMEEVVGKAFSLGFLKSTVTLSGRVLMIKRDEIIAAAEHIKERPREYQGLVYGEVRYSPPDRREHARRLAELAIESAEEARQAKLEKEGGE